MTKEERIKKRYNSEKRFKLYGITSVVLAILFVVFLINVIFSKGSSAFKKTTINVEVNFTLDSLYLDENPNKDDLENVEYYDLAIESLLKVYPVNGLKEEKALINLFSPDYEYEIRNFLIKNPNFLILDEPTNDLDIVTLNVLENFLLDFPGCLIVVSHDRYFMDKIVDHLFVFRGNSLVEDFPGNYSDFRVYEDSKLPKNKKIISGDPEKIKKIYDTWVFSRDTTSANPNWQLVSTLCI